MGLTRTQARCQRGSGRRRLSRPAWSEGRSFSPTAASFELIVPNTTDDMQGSTRIRRGQPDTGATVWMYDSGVGSTLGRMERGSATDGKTVYFANAAGGFWGAVDIATGNLKWKTTDPTWTGTGDQNDNAAVSVANGVVYAGSLGGGRTSGATSNTMNALDAATGHILWSYASGSSVASGPAIVNGTVYWGTGYGRFGLGAPAGAHNFYAFTLH